jgi:hypothetical protein
MGSGASVSSKHNSSREANVARITSRDESIGRDNSMVRVGSPDGEKTFVQKYKHTYRLGPVMCLLPLRYGRGLKTTFLVFG